MKQIFTILFLFFLSFSLLAIVPPKYSSDNYHIKGNAKNFTLKVYKAIDKYYTVDVGELTGLVSFIIYEKGSVKNIYEFNNQGFAEFWYAMDFDKYGNLQSEKKYNGIGSLNSYSQIKLGNTKKISQRDVFKGNGNRLYSEIYEYDKNGNLVEEKKINTREDVLSKIVYNYDTAHRLISLTQYKNDVVVQFKDVFEYEYDKKVIEERYGKDEDLISRKLFKYDEHGNVIWMRKISPNTQDLEISFRYEYDTNGNWIKKVSYQNRMFPTYIVFREIVY